MAKSKVLHDLSPADLSNHPHKSSIPCVPVILKDLKCVKHAMLFPVSMPCKYYFFCLKCFTLFLVLLLFFKIQFKLHMLGKAFSGAFTVLLGTIEQSVHTSIVALIILFLFVNFLHQQLAQ